MPIILSCGHELKDQEEGWSIATKEYSKDWSRAVSYRTVCKTCHEWYEKEDLVLHTQQEEFDWIRGED